MHHSRMTRTGLLIYGVVCLLIVYLPLVAIGFASLARSPYLTFPLRHYGVNFYIKAYHSSTVAGLVATSLRIAIVVMVVSMIVGFFGALAFARYRWRFRKAFQKFALLPIFFPQPVLGLSLLMWFSALGIIPTWKTAIVAHLVWIAPIATLIIAIQAYSFDPDLEDAARDMGANSWQILTNITLPLLWPGTVAAGLFAFLLSWGNFPLSLYTDGADVTLPEWLYAKMVSGYSPLVPVVGTASVIISAIVLILAIIFVRWYMRMHSVSRVSEQDAVTQLDYEIQNQHAQKEASDA